MQIRKVFKDTHETWIDDMGRVAKESVVRGCCGVDRGVSKAIWDRVSKLSQGREQDSLMSSEHDGHAGDYRVRE